ncbi:MAG: hypothetical protein Q8L95_06235 [Burkholderiales bacterium]|nr:hypothetical protein [Burkholderiales bacterium]
MIRKVKNQLAFDESIYPNPAADTHENLGSGVGPKPGRRRAAKQAAVVSPQAYLPGLSRRGRPRLKNAKPAAVRASESRQRRVEAGAKRIELVLEAEIVAQLDALIEHFKISRIEIINRLVGKAAKRIKSKA